MSLNLSKRPDFHACAAPALHPELVLGGKYRLQSLIGEGGMGSVWRACNLALDMPVALKVLRPEVRGTDGVTRLLREARLEARLQHPGIVRVFDYGETADRCPYVVMELLQGSNLADLAARHGGFTPKTAVSLLMPVLDALRAAHRAGIVHRDLKPENIFIAHAGSHWQPKLLDFGIARLHEASARVTLNGSLLGSPAYMAPEQARGLDDVDARADVWSVCVVLYELISGEAAFDADDRFAMLRAVIKQALPPLQGDEAASLWPIMQRGLSKQREARFADADELGSALARWLVQQGVTEDACGEPLHWNWDVIGRRAPAQPSEVDLSPLTAADEQPSFRARLRRVWTRAACALALVPAIVFFATRPAHDERPRVRSLAPAPTVEVSPVFVPHQPRAIAAAVLPKDPL